jgi:uncharacterized membrane protein YfcA
MMGPTTAAAGLAPAGTLPYLLVLFLFVLAFVGGIITAAVGPGGVVFITALYLLTPLAPAEIAGTAGSVFLLGSLVGTLTYARSGDIDYAFALALALASVVGVRGGVWLNTHVSADVFGFLLAAIVVAVGATILYREYHELAPVYNIDPQSGAGLVAVSGIGLAVGCAGGLTGISGSALSVPLLVLLGIPIVHAVAAGLVQGFFITASTATSYALAETTVWSLVVAFAIPYAVGIVVGWRIAHRVESRLLTLSLGGLLILLSGSIVVI